MSTNFQVSDYRSSGEGAQFCIGSFGITNDTVRFSQIWTSGNCCIKGDPEPVQKEFRPVADVGLHGSILDLAFREVQVVRLESLGKRAGLIL